MDKCGIGMLSGTGCGSISTKDAQVSVEFQSISECQRNIAGHLKMLKLRADDVSSEKELILLRAGQKASVTFIFPGEYRLV